MPTSKLPPDDDIWNDAETGPTVGWTMYSDESRAPSLTNGPAVNPVPREEIFTPFPVETNPKM